MNDSLDPYGFWYLITTDGVQTAVFNAAPQPAPADEHPAFKRWATESGNYGAISNWYAFEAWKGRGAAPPAAAQPDAHPETKLDRFLVMVRLWVEHDAGDMDSALAWMYATPVPGARETLVHSLMAAKGWVRGYSEAFVDDYAATPLGTTYLEIQERLAMQAEYARRQPCDAAAPELLAALTAKASAQVETQAPCTPGDAE